MVCGNCSSKRTARIDDAAVTAASSNVFHIEDAPVERFSMANTLYTVVVVRCRSCNRVNIFFDESIAPARRGTTKDKLKMIEDAFRGLVEDGVEVTKTQTGSE